MFVRSDSDHPIDQISSGLMIAIGGEPADETLDLITQQQQVVERELSQVPARAEDRGADFVAKARPQLDTVLTALSSYGDWLKSAKEALESGDPDAMVQAHEASHEIIPTLSSAAEAYSAVYSSFGAYQSVPANGMDRLSDGIISGEVQAPAWKEMVNYYVNGLKQKVQSVKQVELPGKTSLVEGYEEAATQLEKFTAFNPKVKASFTAALKELDNGLNRSEQLEFRMSQAMAGETSIPATNVLLGLLTAYQEGALGQETFESAVDDYSEIMEAFSETFEDSVSKPMDSVLVQDEVPRTLDYLDTHYGAIEELNAAVEGDDKAGIDAAAAKLLDSARKLEESRNVYATAAQHENHVLCPSCSRSNPPENRVCEACGETLPRSADASTLASSTFSVVASQQMLEENQQLVMTENVAKLFDACDDIAAGKITQEAFLAEVNWARAGLKDLSEELDSIAETLMDRSSFTDEQWAVWETQHLPHLEDVAQGFIHGMAECKEGLDRMASFVDDPDNEHLISGVRQVWEGLGAVHRSNLSFQTYSKMIDDILAEVAEPAGSADS